MYLLRVAPSIQFDGYKQYFKQKLIRRFSRGRMKPATRSMVAKHVGEVFESFVYEVSRSIEHSGVVYSSQSSSQVIFKDYPKDVTTREHVNAILRATYLLEVHRSGSTLQPIIGYIR